MTAHPKQRLTSPDIGHNAFPVEVHARSVRRPRGRVRRVARVLVPRRLRRRLGALNDRIQAEMHIASRA